ncbi:hypothetical protein [Mangrovibacterium marinum]|uniref:hypothetical protein n=1 Tax=Mangrovibacterium marinum TaxID=1639118 RepID=UPI002A18DC4E|nr:hypothetical protein [Mangrovibacterium marinum]
MNFKNKLRFPKSLVAIFSVVVISISCLVFHGCSEDADIFETNSKFVNPLDFIGQTHNQGLEYIFKNLETSGNGLKSAQNNEAKMISLTNDFLKTLPKESILFNSQIDYKELGNSMFHKVSDSKLKSASIGLSPEQKYFVDELKIMIKKNIKKKDFERIFEDVAELEERVWNSNMTDDEKYIVLVATSVGKYSSNFWSQKKMKKNNIPRLKSATTEDDDWFDEDAWYDWVGGAVDADIEGSITGAIAGGIVGGIWGSVLLPGVGTITASIVEAVHGGFYGAVIGSAWYGFESLYDSIFN